VCGDSFRQLPQGKQKLRATSGAQPANEQQRNPIMKRAAFLFFPALALLKLNSAVGVAGFRLRRAHQIRGHPMRPRPLDGGRFVRAIASGRPETPHPISLIIPAGSGKIGFKNVW
jgi:hypothetical protein